MLARGPQQARGHIGILFLSSASLLRCTAFICSYFLIWLQLEKDFLFSFPFYLHLKTIFVHFIRTGEGNVTLLRNPAGSPQPTVWFIKLRPEVEKDFQRILTLCSTSSGLEIGTE